MNLEIIERRNDIRYEVPAVSFPAYEEYMDKARQIADYIASVEVSKDSIKDAKKTLADARKLTDRLNGLRIDMKKQILQNYSIVEAQIKEISEVVNEADADLRAKVRELDELERETKKETLRAIWDKRIHAYDSVETHFPNGFDEWLKPAHLNKTTPVSRSEKEMVEWMETRKKDLDTASTMGDEYLVEYVIHGNLTDAISAVKAKEAVKASFGEYREDDEEKATFEVFGAKDIKLTQMLLEENQIEYIRR